MVLESDLFLYFISKGDILLHVDYILSHVDYITHIPGESKRCFDQFLLFILPHLKIPCGSFTYESFTSLEGLMYSEDDNRNEILFCVQTEGWHLNQQLMSVKRCHRHF